MDTIDSADISACDLVYSVCLGNSNSTLLMAAFYSSTLKILAKYRAILNDSKSHLFSTTTVEFK